MNILSKIKDIWATVFGWISSPMSLVEKARKSPIFFVLMLFFMVQPLVSFYVNTMEDIGWIERKIDYKELAKSNKQLIEELQIKVAALEAEKEQQHPPTVK